MLNLFTKFSISCKNNCRYLNIVQDVTLKGRGVDPKTKLVYGGDLSIPIPENSFGSILFERLMRPDRRNETFQIGATSEREVTTAECIKNAVALAKKFQNEGVQIGDHIFFLGKNSINMNTALLGTFFMGAVPLPVTSKTSLDELKIILKSISPKFFGCDRENLFIFKQAVTQSAQYDANKIFLLDQAESDITSETQLKTFPQFIDGLGENWESFKPAEIKNAKEELALLMKAVSLDEDGKVVKITHHNLNAVIARFDSKAKNEKALMTNILMVQKVSWMSGIYSLILSCCWGKKLVVMSDFDENTFGRAIDKFKVTTTFLFSSKLWQIYKHSFRNYDFSSCKYIHVVDGSLPETLIKGVEEQIGVKVRSCFSMTELTGLVLMWYPTSKVTSVGQLIPSTYGKVLSTKNGQKVGPNEKGELCFKGPTIIKGYLNNEKATRQLLDKEGYILTGRFGYYDEDGDFFVLDRILNVIQYKDQSISPRQLEGIIKSLDSVKDACVAGIRHEKHGYCPIAFVALQKNKKLTEEEIIQHVNGKVPDFKRLRGGVVFVLKIPRTRDTGAVRRSLIDNILSKYKLKTTIEDDDVPPVKDKPKKEKV